MKKRDKHVTFTFHIERSYLELARSLFDVRFVTSDGSRIPLTKVSETTSLALLSMTYIYSYTSIVAFVSSQLAKKWDEENSPLRNKYPDIDTINELLKKSLLI